MNMNFNKIMIRIIISKLIKQSLDKINKLKILIIK